MTSKHRTATPSLTGTTRTHFTFVFAEADVPDLAALRHRFDPDMAAIVPPHVTVVYPEEHANLHTLVERARSITTKLSPFTLTGVDFVSDSDAGNVAVFVTLDDASGTLQQLRNELLSPASSIRDIPIHLTIVHPRTSERGDEARDLLADQSPHCHLLVRALALTVTDQVHGMRVIDQFPLTGDTRVLCAGVLLVEGPKVLLAHRSADRAWCGGLWDVIGGHIESDESPVAAACREVAEELGVVIDPADLVHVETVIADDYELVLFSASNWQGEPHNLAPAEHSELGWFDAAQITALDLADPSINQYARAAIELRRT